MAVNFYGNCTGNSGSKYNVWLEANENSQDITENTSNVTVKLKLKRNDGYALSAYNLNSSDNTATISIGGVKKVSVNLPIDTRNSVTVLLAEWTGDVTHNSDGSLSLSLAGSFTMSGTALESGSVSGVLKLVDIPRKSSFTVSKKSFDPLDDVTVSITVASSAFTHKIVWEIGEYKETYSLSSGVTESTLNIPLEWANAIPNSKSGIVKLTVKTYNGKKLVGSSVKALTLKLSSSEELMPDFDIGLEQVKDGVVPSLWNVLVQNKSTVKVSVLNAEYKYGASKGSSFAVVCSVKKSGLPCKFLLTESGVVGITVRLTDSRGIYKEKTVVTSVAEYFNPTVSCNTLIRCSDSGTPLNTGTCVYAEILRNCAGVNGLNYSTVKVRYKKCSEAEYCSDSVIAYDNAVLEGPFEENSSYDFVFTITDAITKSEFTISRVLPSSSIPFNIKKGGKGAAFGCFAETENELTVGYDLRVLGVIKATSFEDSVTVSSVAEMIFSKIKRYDCLNSALQLIASVRLKSSVSANIWTEIFQISGATLSLLQPLSVVIVGQTVQQTVYAQITATGSVQIKSGTAIASGSTLNISGFIA